MANYSRRRSQKIAAIFLLPALVVLFVTTIYPLLYSLESQLPSVQPCKAFHSANFYRLAELRYYTIRGFIIACSSLLS